MEAGKRSPLYVLDKTFETLAVVDVYISSVWTERYNDCGDFELVVPMTEVSKALFVEGRYLVRNDSEYVMVIETLEPSYDPENGDILAISGRTVESFLERRIIWGIVTVSGNLEAVVSKLINENVINPSDPNRKISEVQYSPSSITVGSIEAQYFGDNLYESIVALCKNESVGFKMVLLDKKLIFSLYAGLDRSYEQTENDYVVFSHTFGNLISSDQVISNKLLKNVCLIAGEGEGPERMQTSVGNSAGLIRREIFVDAGSVSQRTGERDPETDEEILYPDEEYERMLQQEGIDELTEHTATDTFDGEINYNSTFQYGVDYTIGDIVSVVSPYSNNRKARITEFIRSSDETGDKEYPTFEILEKEA